MKINDSEIDITARLFENRDEKYAAFTAKLCPGVDPKRIIGVRSPAIRAIAKELRGSKSAEWFIAALPHEYHEENMLHAVLIGSMRSFDEAIAALDNFLPFVDNWAVCDTLRPTAFKKHLPEALENARRWIASRREYTVRFGVDMLMTYFLDDAFEPAILELAASPDAGEYYVSMMIAWCFATALAKQYDTALPFIEKRVLDPKTHNRTIRKAIESYRITDEQKAYLRSLTIKTK